MRSCRSDVYKVHKYEEQKSRLHFSSKKEGEKSLWWLMNFAVDAGSIYTKSQHFHYLISKLLTPYSFNHDNVTFESVIAIIITVAVNYRYCRTNVFLGNSFAIVRSLCEYVRNQPHSCIPLRDNISYFHNQVTKPLWPGEEISHLFEVFVSTITNGNHPTNVCIEGSIMLTRNGTITLFRWNLTT